MRVLLLLCIFTGMSLKMSNVQKELSAARQAAGLSQDELATKANLSRMTVQRAEADTVDPRLSTLLTMARALGLELMVVPTALRPQLEEFVRSGGRFLGQAAGVGAPASIVDDLVGDLSKPAPKK